GWSGWGDEENGCVFVPQTPEKFVHDLDGNLIQDGRWKYSWDAENRMNAVEELAVKPGHPKRKIEFAYDWQGRRISKTITQTWGHHACGFERKTTRVFINDGWNLIAEFEQPEWKGRCGKLEDFMRKHWKPEATTYLWGLDASGTMSGAGGVGGILAIDTPARGSHFFSMDGNGNVAALVDAKTGRATAKYEYSPAGELIRGSGIMAKANCVRFSSKYFDPETGLGYWGERYYNPSTGRWTSREPLEEAGSLNLYAFCRNDPILYIDVLGRESATWPPANRPDDPRLPPPPSKDLPSKKDTTGATLFLPPNWFLHPADEGKPCSAGKVGPGTATIKRIDPPATKAGDVKGAEGSTLVQWTLHFEADIQMKGCWKDLAVLWGTCLRSDNTALYIPECINKTACNMRTYTGTQSGVPLGGPYMTRVVVRWLSCENNKWTVKQQPVPRNYSWDGKSWSNQ
ncbi:MAG: RHS repeat-associated core domain-containing protein, partial [Elusimicrobiales bacterium]|nr:RHS repeat-associated core domain-containing protein [Elusimicrobiales bacterium]